MFRRMLIASLRARRGRLVLALLAVTLGVAVSIALAMLAIEVGDDLARTLRAAGPNFVVLPAGARWPLDLGGATFEPARGGLSLAEAVVPELKRSFWKNNVLEAAPELAVPAAIAGTPATVIGTWFDHVLPEDDIGWRTGLARLRPHWSIEGRWPHEGTEEIAIGRALARRIDAGPGARVQVALGGSSVQWLVTGVVSAGGREDMNAWAPLSRVQALTHRLGQVDRVWMSALVSPPPVKAAPDPARDPAGYERWMCTPYAANVARDLADRLAGADVLPMTEVVAGEGRVVGRLDLLMLLLALAALAASVLGLFSTSTATVVERSVELGLLRSLGATSNDIAALLLCETALVGLAGGTLGWALGLAAAAMIRGQAFGSSTVFTPLLLPFALIIALLVSVLGTLGPLRMALRLDPAAVLRG